MTGKDPTPGDVVEEMYLGSQGIDTGGSYNSVVASQTQQAVLRGAGTPAGSPSGRALGSSGLSMEWMLFALPAVWLLSPLAGPLSRLARAIEPLKGVLIGGCAVAGLALPFIPQGAFIPETIAGAFGLNLLVTKLTVGLSLALYSAHVGDELLDALSELFRWIAILLVVGLSAVIYLVVVFVCYQAYLYACSGDRIDLLDLLFGWLFSELWG